eukprot:gnl/TRDRNA2_/TRDRNA2_162879_c1_seq1.p1 gnl/TRDRNA2_/TRDRNA2_162879_c1~~gnl/TRDRNA2_/TRDRNA2_162879_c1_seq1.p1  ORF type:complete len:213 (-),score=64.37 gnl/TRDRNA2_/TRDRNA2_162879_c1_seq1:343-981(-)
MLPSTKSSITPPTPAAVEEQIRKAMEAARARPSAMAVHEQLRMAAEAARTRTTPVDVREQIRKAAEAARSNRSAPVDVEAQIRAAAEAARWRQSREAEAFTTTMSHLQVPSVENQIQGALEEAWMRRGTQPVVAPATSSGDTAVAAETAPVAQWLTEEARIRSIMEAACSRRASEVASVMSMGMHEDWMAEAEAEEDKDSFVATPRSWYGGG